MTPRHQLKILLGLAALTIGALACQRGNTAPGKIVVVFVDVSGSVRDFGVYREAWSRITDPERFRGGDRLVLGRITDETYTQFRPVLDRELPVYNPLADNKLDYEKRKARILGDLPQALETALTGRRSHKTDVMNTLVLGEKIFKGDRPQRSFLQRILSGDSPRHRVLVILSDMLEDSEEHNLERTRITDEFIARVIENSRQRKLLPDLGGAAVYVAGASARTAGKAQEVQRFWVEYMRAANAKVPPENYGPALVHFNE